MIIMRESVAIEADYGYLTANESNIRGSRIVRIAMQQNTVELKENMNTTRAASTAAKEAWKASELAVKVVKDIKALES
ncbi:hypothetical protein CLIM01_11703 [Colletotrichum limetticola]|uniref:Uncharacterized protein n=2 Tax=Colletotrichum acutatum species complex TaxID=2707335 RepID=A0ABQ9PKG3_9PEZI|nr:hypothetical protein CLIM01_11703 [Colletotrichum limetticola]